MTTITTRAGKGSSLSWNEVDTNFTNLNEDKADLDSPSLIGVPTAPTAVTGTNTTQLATTAFVQGKTASQTPSSAAGNITSTNVQSALEELDTEKASLTGATFSGQVTATKLQAGVSGTNTNNFIFDATAADGTMVLERGNGQDIMTVDAAGKVLFDQGVTGYSGTASSFKLPTWLGGWLLQWGFLTKGTVTAGSYNADNVTLPVTMASTSNTLALCSLSGILSAPTAKLTPACKITAVNQIEVSLLSDATFSNQPIFWFVLGK